MKVKVIMKHRIERELVELRWLINKLEEMKNGRCWTERMHGTEEEFLDQNQSYQFFLGLRSSQVVIKGDGPDIK